MIIDHKELNNWYDCKLPESTAIEDIEDWIEESATDDFYFGAMYVTFKSRDDATLFKLMWG